MKTTEITEQVARLEVERQFPRLLEAYRPDAAQVARLAVKLIADGNGYPYTVGWITAVLTELPYAIEAGHLGRARELIGRALAAVVAVELAKMSDDALRRLTA